MTTANLHPRRRSARLDRLPLRPPFRVERRCRGESTGLLTVSIGCVDGIDSVAARREGEVLNESRENHVSLVPFMPRRSNARLQPRRLIMAPTAGGCKRPGEASREQALSPAQGGADACQVVPAMPNRVVFENKLRGDRSAKTQRERGRPI